jgi:hypothetical protein
MSDGPGGTATPALRGSSWGAWLGRLALVAAFGVVVAAASWWLFRRAQVGCPGVSLAGLEVAGTPERAGRLFAACGGIGPKVRGGLWVWWLLGIAALVVVPAVAAWRLGRRVYRLRVLRAAGAAVLGAALLALALHVVATLLVLVLAGAGAHPAWLSGIAATLAWGGWVSAAVALGYALGALGNAVVTPAWLRDQLAEPPEGELVERADDPSRTHSLALSGGGVRSASFALGGLQQLEAGDLSWGTASRITAVSGGAYMAGAWSIARTDRRQDSLAPDANADCWSKGSPEERHLLDDLGYLLSSEPRQAPRVHRRSDLPSTTSGTSGTSGGTAIGTAATPPAMAAGARPARDVPGVLATVGVGLLFNVAVLLLLLWVLARPLGWLVGSCAIEPALKIPYAGGQMPSCVAGDVPARAFSLGAQQQVPVVVWACVTAVLLVVWVLAGRLRGIITAVRGLHTVLRPAVLVCASVTAVLAVLLIAVPWVMIAVPGLFGSIGGIGPGPDAQPSTVSRLFQLLSSLGVIGAVVGALRAPAQKLAPRLGGVLLLLVGVLVGGQWASDAAIAGVAGDRTRYLWLLATFLVICCTSPEWWSLAPFYRGRLRQAYATYRERGRPEVAWAYENADTPADRAEPSLYELDAAASPRLRVCASATVSDRAISTHYGIPALSVTFDPDHVSMYEPLGEDGRAQRHRCRTAALERLGYRWDSPRLTTTSAVGMAGAAVAPALGRESLGSTNALLAFANVRLGVWIPNPRYVRASEGAADPGTEVRPAGPRTWLPYPRLRVGYLLKELVGLHDASDLYVYIADGGHWENTGLVELVRGGIDTEIVSFDASGVPLDALTSLAEAVGLAPLECGVTIDIELDQLRERLDEPAGHRYARRSVTLGLVRAVDGSSVGLLWYAKPVLTQDSPLTALALAERLPDFPATSTLDQFFDTERFEGYRALGRFCADRINEARADLLRALRSCGTFGEFAQDPGAGHRPWPVAVLTDLLERGDDPAREYAALRARLL